MVGAIGITTAQGATWNLSVQEQVDGLYPAVVNGTQAAYLIDQRSFTRLFPAFETFKPVEGEINVSAEEDLPPGMKRFTPGRLLTPGHPDHPDNHAGHNH